MTSLLAVDLADPASLAADEASAQTRIVDAALRCIARWGLAKTTLDDVAREAGVGRATVYRLFPGGRDALFDRVITTETLRFLGRIESVAADVDSLEDLLVAAICEAGTTLETHAALQFLVAHEPETILPCLAFQNMDAILRVVGTLFGTYLAPYLPSHVDPQAAPRGAEWVARIVFSYLVAPSPEVDFHDPSSVRHIVRTYILPGLAPIT